MVRKARSRNVFIYALCAALVFVSASFISCKTVTAGRIDAPERVEAKVGKYVSPAYKVVDKDGNELAGYTVSLLSVADADGNALTVTNGTVTVTKAGTYTFVYTAGGGKIPDARVEVVFTEDTESGPPDTGEQDVKLFVPSEQSVQTLTNGGNTVSFDTEYKHGTENGSLKVIANTSDAAVWLPVFDYFEYDYAEFYVYTSLTSAQAGTQWVGDTALTPNQWTRVQIHFGLMDLCLKTSAGESLWPNNQHKGQTPEGKLALRFMHEGGGTFYVSTIALKKFTRNYSENQVSAIAYARTIITPRFATLEYDDNKKVTVNDPNVTERGSLKVTVGDVDGTHNEVYLATDAVLMTGKLDACSEIYFYVYTEVADTLAGSWWCGDARLTPGQWTKVTITKGMEGLTGIQQGTNAFENGASRFIFRLAGWHEMPPLQKGQVFWVSSLYAVKA